MPQRDHETPAGSAHAGAMIRAGMTRRRMLGRAGAALGALAVSDRAAARQASPVAAPVAAGNWRDAHWVGTWAMAPRQPFSAELDPDSGLPPLADRTFRQVVRTTIGGAQVRVRLTNAYAGEPTVVGAATIAIASGGAGGEGGIAPGTERVLPFGGRPGVTLPPEAVVVSDPVELDVPALGDLAVSLYLPGSVIASRRGLQTIYVSPPGDFTAEPALTVEETARSFLLLAGVDVASDEAAGAVVALGDSITEGVGSTPGANHRWTDRLAERLTEEPDRAPLGVLNLAIDGNRLLHDGYAEARFAVGANALARFDRDVLAQPGATHLVLLQGLGDIGAAVAAAAYGVDAASEVVTVEDIIAGQRIIIDRAHQHGLVVIGGTLTSIGGSVIDAPETEAMRQELNDWIRGGGAFDAVIDFDAAARDPADPSRLPAAFDSGDHGHLSDAGYRALGEAIDLALFRSATD